MGTVLYQIVIQPLVVMLEFFYELFFEVLHSKGIAVIGLSFVVTLLTLPLYMIAESWQEIERQKQAAMAGKISRIKRAFKGDEQYMMLSAYYREERYKPIYALRSSFSLLVQIPFFIAAYHYLSNLGTLRGYSFLFIKDFGAPDAMFHIGSFPVNVLPIAMTVINCVAGYIYSKGHPRREKIQIYLCALVFLALLYTSPAGLVLYWTMNNVLSLVKNIFYKLRKPGRILYICLCLFSLMALLAGLGVMRHAKPMVRFGLIAMGLSLPFVPFVVTWLRSFNETHFLALDDEPKTRLLVFLCAALGLAVLAGLFIPATLMASEPEQYCYVDSYTSPLVFIAYPLLQAIGLFLFWPGCFYALFGKRVKKEFAIIWTLLLCWALVNALAFSGSYGPIEPTMLFMEPQTFRPTMGQFFGQFACTVLVGAVVLLVFEKRATLMGPILAIVLFALAAMGGKDVVAVYSAYTHMEKPQDLAEPEPVFHLTQTGKNVIVLMQDRMYSPMVEPILAEHPELKSQFDGFVFYPNTASFGKYTMIGTPGLFGGYDYTPFEMNRRTGKTLQQKHNEALLTMPVLFHQNGWNVSVSDLPYENYLQQPVTDMYAGYPYVDRVQTHGVYSKHWYAVNGVDPSPYTSFMIKRNLVFFSIFKMVPPILRRAVYHKKYWLSYNPYDDTAKFVDNYSELDLLPELTDFSSDADSLVVLDNEATHEAIYLMGPEYRKAGNNEPGSKWSKEPQYTSMTGVMYRLGEFFQYLKDNGVYDNTRIIIVSDHGMGFDSGLFTPTKGVSLTKDCFVATLLVKDFARHGAIRKDDAFMTNADTPVLASEGLIADARNPFTQNPLKVEDKNAWMKLVDAPAEATRIRKNSEFSIAPSEWFTVKDDIYNPANWARYTGPLPEATHVDY